VLHSLRVFLALGSIFLTLALIQLRLLLGQENCKLRKRVVFDVFHCSMPCKVFAEDRYPMLDANYNTTRWRSAKRMRYTLVIQADTLQYPLPLTVFANEVSCRWAAVSFGSFQYFGFKRYHNLPSILRSEACISLIGGDTTSGNIHTGLVNLVDHRCSLLRDIDR